MAQKVINKALGLHTFKNNLTVPDGAMEIADNVIIDRDGIVESRRGFNIDLTFGIGDDRAKQLLQYKDRLLLHYSNKLLFENSGVLSEFSGDYSELDTGLRIKGLETSGNYYFTTSDGVKKISATASSQLSTDANYILESGAPRALDNTGKCNYTTSGFLTPLSITSYQVVWGYVDENSNLILGFPSETTTILNLDASNSCTVDLDITIPTEISANSNPQGYFYQVYRSSIKQQTAAAMDDNGLVNPADYSLALNGELAGLYALSADTEFQLVIEDFPSSPELTAGTTSINDITAEDFRGGGALLYTNPISGEGIAQGNTRPPLCKDIEFFKGSTFYSNTQTRHNKTVSLISVDDFIGDPAVTQTEFIIANEDQITTYVFQGKKQTTNFNAVTDAAGANTSLNGKYWTINSSNDNRSYYVWYNSDGLQTDPAITGKIGIEIDTSSSPTILDVVVLTVSTLDNLIDFDVTQEGVTAEFNAVNSNNGAAVESTVGTLGLSITVGTAVGEEGLGEDTTTDPKSMFLSADPSVGIKLEESAKSIVRVINSNLSEDINAFYLSSATDLPGQMNFENKSSADKPFYIGTNQTNIAGNFNPTLPIIQPGLVVSTPDLVTVRVAWTAHAMKVGDIVILNNSTDVIPAIAGKAYAITNVPDANSFDVSITTTSLGGSPTVDAFKGTEKSDNEKKPNRVYYSKDSIPEAVPALNYFDIGAKDKSIDRIIALRDSLFILKQDGVYRLSGTDVANFSVTLSDASSPIIAPDSVAVLNNKIFVLTTQGIVSIGEGGTDIESRNIEEDILFPTSNNFSSFSTQAFGIASESDRSYYLWLPTVVADTVATQCYRFNVFTKAWTRWDIAKTCGIVKNDDDKIYLGASDTNYVEKERKNFLRTDYADREFSNIILATTDSTQFTLSDLAEPKVFDAIYQEQYITIARFNRLLSRLDKDSFLAYETYTNIPILDVVWQAGTTVRYSFDPTIPDISKIFVGDTFRVTGSTNASNDGDFLVTAVEYELDSYIEVTNAARIDATDDELTSPSVGDVIRFEGYTGEYGASIGSSIGTLLSNLISRIDANDTDTSYTPFTANDGIDAVLAAYNILVTELNGSLGVFTDNFRQYSDLVKYEAIISEIKKVTNRVVVLDETPFILGNITVYKAIACFVEYAPENLGDTSLLKHFREATLMFDQYDFTFGQMGFRSDLSASISTQLFTAGGNGDYGSSVYGEEVYGGLSNEIPFRTYVPLDKQRCRMIYISFEHTAARESFKLIGYSVTYKEKTSSRGYR